MNATEGSFAVDIVSKAEFASICNVHKSRVSHWIADGKISGDALVGEGRDQRIHVQRAKAQLLKRLDAVQMAGNGISTELKAPPAPTAAELLQRPPAAPTPLTDTIEEQIKRERLDILRAQNRKLAEEEAARAGRYVETESVRQQFGRMAAEIVTEIEGRVPEIATDLANQFKWSQRDVLHALRSSFQNLRVRLSARFSQKAATLPNFIQSETPGDASAEIEVADE